MHSSRSYYESFAGCSCHRLPTLIKSLLREEKTPLDSVAHAIALMTRLRHTHSGMKAEPESGLHTFLAAFMISTKLLQDDAPRNVVWCGLTSVPLRQINQFERELCNYLVFEFRVPNIVIKAIVDQITLRVPTSQAHASAGTSATTVDFLLRYAGHEEYTRTVDWWLQAQGPILPLPLPAQSTAN